MWGLIFKPMFGLRLPEIIIIALVVLLLFGGKKIPEMMKGLGRGVKSFKDGLKEGVKEDAPSETKANTDETGKDAPQA